MYIQTEKGEGITAYNVMNLTPAEMNTIVEMDKKIADTLISHHPEFKGKKLYLTDDDLFTIRGILWSFARYAKSFGSNTFDIQKNEIIEQFNGSHFNEPANVPTV